MIKAVYSRSLPIMLYLIIFSNLNLHAQKLSLAPFFGRIGNQELETPYLGGLNNPFVQTIDLDLDGQEELWLVDRDGQVSMIYRWGGNRWVFAENMSQNLPPVDSWHLLVDFDQDGIKDLFTFDSNSSPRGITLYYGQVENEMVRFVPADFSKFTFDILSYESRPGRFTNIYLDPADLPAIGDVDLDGDIDILAFGTGGLTIHYYRNMQVEDGRAPGDYRFILDDSCWGKIVEDGLSATIIISSDTTGCGNSFHEPYVELRHAGSSLLLNDRDGDGRMDLIVGDVGTTTLLNLFDSGLAKQAFVQEYESDFPLETDRVDIPIFPFPMHVDLNQDGLLDFLAAPGDIGNSDNINNLWYYRNTSDNEVPVYTLENRRLFGEQMFDFGSLSYSTIMDVNADGFKDIIVGTRGTYPEEITSDARLILLENVNGEGFEVVDEDYVGLSILQSETATLAPAAGDVDSDGDLDLVVGEASGRLIYLENVAGPNQPVSFKSPVLPFQNIDVGIQSHPCIYDVNLDGLQDLVIGESNGNINYFMNKGSVETPQFDEVADHEFFGSIDTRKPGFFFGSSAPFIYSEENQTYLITGSEELGLRRYVLAGLTDPFPLVDTLWGAIDQGNSTSVTLGDLNNNGKLEAVVSNVRGGIAIYSTNIDDITTSSAVFSAEIAVKIYPNPASDHLFISRNGSGSMRFDLFTIHGQKVLSDNVRDEWIDISGLQPGIYYVQLQVKNEQACYRIVVQ